MNRKGISQLVSYVLFLAVLLSALIVTINSIPIKERMTDTCALKHASDFLSRFDSNLRLASQYGASSKRQLILKFDRGTFYLKSDQNQFYYELETSSEAFSANQSQKLAGIKINVSNDEKKTVRLILNYQDLNLTGLNHLNPGAHTLYLENKGIKNNQTVIKLSRKNS